MKEKAPDTLLQYAGYAVQLAVALGLSVWVGIWMDEKIRYGIPIVSWLLPLVVLIAMLYKVVKDTSKK